MFPKPFRRALIAAPALLLGTVFLAHRQGARAQEPTPAVTLGRQEVSAQVDDRHSLAVTTVLQEFVNPTRAAMPGSCSLPIPDEAAIIRFRVLSPPPARARKAEDLGSLSSSGHNQYLATVNAVPAHGRAQIEVVYAEPVIRRGRKRKYVYPIPAPASGTASQSLRVRISASGPLQHVGSSTHRVRVEHPSARSAVVAYDTPETPDGRDLVVDYELPLTAEDSRAHLAVLPAGDRSRQPYFLLTLPPPAALLRDARTLDQPADIVFCADTSGSTRGRKLNAIQEALHDVLTDLSPVDRFGVVAFDDEERAFRRQLVSASGKAVTQALQFVNRLRPGAGSDPERGLRAALALLGPRAGAPPRPAFLVILVDDDDPADLGPAIQRLHADLAAVKLVALGVLPDARLVNYRIRGKSIADGPAVALTRAAVTYGPALTAPAFDPGPLNVSYVYPSPQRLPNLPLSTPVLLFGRLEQAPPQRGTVTLRGKVEGAERTLPVEFSWQPLPPDSPVPALWASRRIHRLQQLAERGRGDSEELLGAVPRIQAEHGLAAVPEQ